MRNLHTLMLEGIVNTFRIGECEELEEALMNTLFSQLPKLHCLQHLYVDDIYVLVGSLAEWLRCLKKPLETLSITFCHLIQRDLDYLPQCQNLSGLKHLYLSHTILEEWFKPLGKLLERVKDTLQTLDLEKCWLEDSAFNDFMPALSQCSQLLKINFFNNKLSLPLLKQLLQHTAKLNKLTQELYPVPLECYDNRGLLLRERFDEICPELLDILRTKRQPKAVSFVSSICPTCFQSCVYDLESRYCLCWQ
ncbi:Oog1 [Lemmus lemmus]